MILCSPRETFMEGTGESQSRCCTSSFVGSDRGRVTRQDLALGLLGRRWERRGSITGRGAALVNFYRDGASKRVTSWCHKSRAQEEEFIEVLATSYLRICKIVNYWQNGFIAPFEMYTSDLLFGRTGLTYSLLINPLNVLNLRIESTGPLLSLWHQVHRPLLSQNYSLQVQALECIDWESLPIGYDRIEET
jgi:hypothetical protein